jgi:hypothetical protein
VLYVRDAYAGRLERTAKSCLVPPGTLVAVRRSKVRWRSPTRVRCCCCVAGRPQARSAAPALGSSPLAARTWRAQGIGVGADAADHPGGVLEAGVRPVSDPKQTGLPLDLERYLRCCNTQRAHTGRCTRGRTPQEVLGKAKLWHKQR